jgi:riboflavin kinase / FMN adenylyltransferase
MASPNAGPPTIERLIAIGNFDGVHIGHAHLLSRVLETARRRQIAPSVLTFEPHPAHVLGREAPRTLTRLSRKLELLAEVSSELEVIVEPFDLALAQSSPQKFAELLAREHSARLVVVGENFRFGRDRAGNLDTLKRLGSELGFDVEATELLTVDAEPVSSSRIRKAIADGALPLATRLLGRPHRLSGVVRSGDGRGRTIGFPTANLAEVTEMLPPLGVYAVRALLQSDSPAEAHDAVLNVGVRPTFGAGAVSVEAHLLDYQGDLVGSTLALELVARLREEQRFSGVEALKQQIAIDVAAARQHLSHGTTSE